MVDQGGTVTRIEVGEGKNAIDLLIDQGWNVGVTGLSIYAIEKDTLRYCNGDPRPTAFTTSVARGGVYLLLRRADKPAR